MKIRTKRELFDELEKRSPQKLREWITDLYVLETEVDKIKISREEKDPDNDINFYKNAATNLVQYLKEEIIKNDGVVVCPILYGGLMDFDAYLMEPFRKHFQNEFDVVPLSFKGSPSPQPNQINPRKRRYLMLYDDSMKTGESVVEAWVWLLSNMEAIRIEEIITVISRDFSGGSNFCFFPAYLLGDKEKEWLYPRGFLKEKYPWVYKEIEQEGKIKYLAGKNHSQ